tara:strand:- start:3456 stop:4166 length:711 start_codon:yes stop_codon:yes gene_type:complete
MKIKKANINGLDITPFKSMNHILDFIDENKKILIAINAEKIVNADNKLKKVINDHIGYCDGFGAILAINRIGIQSIQIPGFQLWLEIVKKYCEKKSFYFVGSKEKTIKMVIKKLKNQFPKINIKNFHNGYFNKVKENNILMDIKNKKPDIVFVAMGSPKQERLMEKMFKVHPAIYQGLGGSFDVYVGKVKSPGGIWIKLKLMWFIRIIRQPRLRLKRLPTLIKFIFILMKIKKINN